MRKWRFLFVVFIMGIFLHGCNNTVQLIEGLDDLNDEAISIGAMTGSTGEHLSQKRFAKASTMKFGSLVAALSSGKADIIADGLAITKERKKHVAFSDSYNNFKTGVLVLKENHTRLLRIKT